MVLSGACLGDIWAFRLRGKGVGVLRLVWLDILGRAPREVDVA